MSKLMQNYEQLAVGAGLRFDASRKVIYGQKNGFSIMAYAANASYPYILTVALSAKSPMGALTKADTKSFVKGEKPVSALTQQGNEIKMVIKGVSNQNKLCENFVNSVNALISFLRSKGFEPCCQFCGQQIETQDYEVRGSYMHLCPDCAGKLRSDMTMATQQKQQKRENIIGGIVGALLGSMIGILCIIFFAQLERVAAVSGVIMAVCAIKGYELLGGRLSKIGVVISVAMMVVMTYVGNYLMVAISIAGELDMGLFDAMQVFPELWAMDMIDTGVYYSNLFMLYAFTLLGAIPTVRANLKEREQESTFGQIGTTNTNTF